MWQMRRYASSSTQTFGAPAGLRPLQSFASWYSKWFGSSCGVPVGVPYSPHADRDPPLVSASSLNCDLDIAFAHQTRELLAPLDQDERGFFRHQLIEAECR